MPKKVVVIGGGIVGLCCAYFLQKEGHEVQVYDKGNMDSGASWINAGYLTPSHIVPLASPEMLKSGLKFFFKPNGPVFLKPRFSKDFFSWSFNFYKSAKSSRVRVSIPIIKDLNLESKKLYLQIREELGHQKVHLKTKGLLMLFKTEALYEEELKVAQKAMSLGLKVNSLSPKEVEIIDSTVSSNLYGALHYLDDGHSTPPIFMETLINHLKNSGVQLFTKSEITRINHKNGLISCLKSHNSIIEADEYVMAAGVWSQPLAQQLGLSLPIEAGKGYAIKHYTTNSPSLPALLMEAKIAITPMANYLSLAGTMELSGINHEIRKNRVNQIAIGATPYYKHLIVSEEEKNSAACGLRPLTPDGLPYIGRSNRFKNLTIATGHAMMGWSLGPITGQMVSDLISHKEHKLLVQNLHPDRKF